MFFFKQFWETIKDDIFRLCDDFYAGKANLERINWANIALIPKVESPESPGDFRPISLINSSLKIISKLLAIRLGKVMNDLVDFAQSAFLRGRCILDNVAIAEELIFSLKKRRIPGYILKEDFSKAFDLVDWEFLLDLLKARGFGSKWLGWIERILASTKANVLINGAPNGYIRYCRGLRQGDPLSPLLFILITDVLSSMFRHALDSRILVGVPLGPGRNRCNLHFADDLLNGGPPGDCGGRDFELCGGVAPGYLFGRTSLGGLPSWVVRAIDWIRRDFLWSGPDIDKPRCRLVSWKALCRDREQGGWGILDLNNFNKALLGKWWWKYANDPDGEGTEVIHFNYGSVSWDMFPRTSGRMSFFWKGVLKILPVLRCCVTSTINSGSETFFWKDRWLNGRAPMNVWPELYCESKWRDATFEELGHLLENQPYCEDEGVIQFRDRWRARAQDGRDLKKWSINGNGMFSVKSLYNFLNDGGTRCEVAKFFWKSKCPKKVNIFNWQRPKASPREKLGKREGSWMKEELEAKALFLSPSQALAVATATNLSFAVLFGGDFNSCFFIHLHRLGNTTAATMRVVKRHQRTTTAASLTGCGGEQRQREDGMLGGIISAIKHAAAMINGNGDWQRQQQRETSVACLAALSQPSKHATMVNNGIADKEQAKLEDMMTTVRRNLNFTGPRNQMDRMEMMESTAEEALDGNMG
ncbi:uncharacterized protein LOC120277606 [Dioscorea cayenensis subsp. rotundata]|uniref:Uncharacterized protein LOC120277606 n=1 Tax=Dioscorea cayennensis subsp. rotundata TaxID=55577 RepID=A0AB40CQH9_DIOCR|nr:uncharacterized protein LOC120277606 [Dioscorea cayenensis subsp. rotundata]